jgi:hypothetical protein
MSVGNGILFQIASFTLSFSLFTNVAEGNTYGNLSFRLPEQLRWETIPFRKVGTSNWFYSNRFEWHSSTDKMSSLGGLVQVNLYSLHRNAQHWGDPDNFRFETQNIAVSKKSVLYVYEWILLLLFS